MAITSVDTMTSMSQTKSVPEPILRRFGEEIRRWVDEKCDGNQSEAGRMLGCSQSHISALISGVRGVGLHFILLFAAETGKSVDELLGMKRGAEGDERIRRLLREELNAIRSEAEAKEREPHAKPLRGRPAARRSVR